MPDAIANLQVPVLLGLVPLLLATALFDLRQMRIPNVLVGAYLCLFAASLLTPGNLDGVALRLLAAGVVLAVGVAGFSFHLLGGGDVKVLSALVLFIPHQWLAVFALSLSVSLLVGIALVQVVRLGAASPTSRWAFLRDTRRFPMGLSIAMAGLSLPILKLTLG
ncbi:A24 family peptidase [Sulfitobacter sabulilitoris]|uniref:Prepilin type IV endopeptidase peptidase domain-containing protein n=1 Tax=Sulfitobacter sabulilitoris TaxID=2562655 RepID=A0A5S3PJS5_9RHOB|nr:prepilin peptidase [Sulfitobacter sabulilitoris]TMM54633.1 hypothetical protein FDT80_03325 [Sulfitobacter sabulilitoris]